MAASATFRISGRNPDVLNSIANLSNDEVFTPPVFANQMLDTLEKAWADANGGAVIWEDPNVTFLDPFTKSGVFLREIVARLTKGLEKEFPVLQDRVDHILTTQVFGIAITHLTSLMARRSVYCSKYANGKHSITKKFDTEDGNIKFEITKHDWIGGKTFVETADADGNPVSVPVDGKCRFCGATQKMLDRNDALETHAYSLIHTSDIEEHVAKIFGAEMQFDVVIGNPPYQLDDGGYGTSAAPIYNKFVEQAKALQPRFLCMVVPARWFSGGKGLDAFRDSMLSDARIRVREDFPDSNDVFPGTQIKGGVCYFLWDRDTPGDCVVATNDKGFRNDPVSRPLLEEGLDVFIRYNEAVPVLGRILDVEDKSKSGNLNQAKNLGFSTLVSSRKPFGLGTTFRGAKISTQGSIKVYENGGIGYVKPMDVPKGSKFVDSWKVFIPRAGSGSDSFPHSILGRPFVGEPGSISTETYLMIGPFESGEIAENVVHYISTRFFRFLVLLHKPTQDATRSVYSFVPDQDFSVRWTDEMLYEKYGITKNEVSFIESMIRPMELTDDDA